MIEKLLLVFLGGGLGSALRYLISEGVFRAYSLTFPLATLVANLLSCLLMVVLIKSGKLVGPGESLRLFLLVGFLGGLSTFSTFSYETSLLMKEGHLAIAFTNIGLSVSVCIYCLYKLT